MDYLDGLVNTFGPVAAVIIAGLIALWIVLRRLAAWLRPHVEGLIKAAVDHIESSRQINETNSRRMDETLTSWEKTGTKVREIAEDIREIAKVTVDADKQRACKYSGSDSVSPG